MNKLIGMFLAGIIAVTASNAAHAQEYRKVEKRVYTTTPPYGRAYGHREHVDVIQSRPYYGYHHHADWDHWGHDRDVHRTIIVNDRRHLDRDFDHDRDHDHDHYRR
jgi:hypothetical protein